MGPFDRFSGRRSARWTRRLALEVGRNISDILPAVLQLFDPSASQIGGGAPLSTTPVTRLLAG